jgi:hypothetical protein
VYVLGPDRWGISTTAVTEIELPYPTLGLKNNLYLCHGKIFMTITLRYTLGLDLTTSCFFILEHPDGVGSNFMLSCADSGIYLVNVDEFQVSIWLRKLTGDDYGACGWQLVNTFCIHDLCTHIVGDQWESLVGDLLDIIAVGDNGGFILEDHVASGVVLYVHLRTRLVEKAYDHPPFCNIHISPLMLIWPPVFPALNK